MTDNRHALRPVSQGQKLPNGDGIYLGDTTVVERGVRVQRVVFDKDGHYAEGIVVVLDPRSVNAALAVRADIATASSPVTFHTAKSLRDFLQNDLPPAAREQLVLATAAPHLQFYFPNTAVIENGVVVTMATEEGIVLNGRYYFLVVHGSQPGMQAIDFTDGACNTDLSSIELAISGPVLVEDGDNVTSRIREFTGDDIRTIRPDEVMWNPKTRDAAFSGLGYDTEGNIVFATLAGDPVKRPEMLIGEFAEVMRAAGAWNAISINGSGDAQVYCEGALTEAKSGATTKRGAFQQGRSLSSIIYFTRTQNPPRAFKP
jgi:hypothetical protein